LAGREGDATLIADGKQHYVSYCQACHGPGGEGNKLFGAPDLTNEIWLYGNSLARIENVVAKGRNGVMPAFGQKLGEDKVRILAAYVISLSAKGDASTK
ncbi:MAG: c-type cytochrome, partial [Gammaproteobacteria bacterium]|nr:c-type cytochrome [Gammaproteobacteria bacterium]